MTATFLQLEKGLKSLKITEKFVLIHFDLHNYPNYVKNLKKFWKTLLIGIGKNKTFIIPTFTINLQENKIWDYHKTKSQTGVFSEYFRKNIAQKRTIHPIHSVCVWGKNYKVVADHKSKSSFGKGSTWEWICNSKDVCNISIGISVLGGATILHKHKEKLKVYYRYFKKFKSIILLKNKQQVKKEFFYFARKKFRNKSIINDWHTCEKDLIKNNILKKKTFSQNLLICKMNTNKATKFLINKLKRNKNYITVAK